jgi:hypothetical protein
MAEHQGVADPIAVLRVGNYSQDMFSSLGLTVAKSFAPDNLQSIMIHIKFLGHLPLKTRQGQAELGDGIYSKSKSRDKATKQRSVVEARQIPAHTIKDSPLTSPFILTRKSSGMITVAMA